ncbi:unnamed protein product [Rotaria sp. Silwood2]|nr:unnamed protein product [Rotaria sp. Silwood2]
MFPNAAPTGSIQRSLPPESPVANWNVFVYRKVEPTHTFHSYDVSQSQNPQQANSSFYIQLQQHYNSSLSSHSNILHLRYKSLQQKNTVDSYTLPFTICLLDDIKLAQDTAPLASTGGTSSSRFYNADQQTVRINQQFDALPTLILRAKAFLGVLVLNNATNSITANTAGVIRPFMIFVTDDVCIGRLFDAYIYRITNISVISMIDGQEDETHVAGIKKLFQARCFYYSKYCKPESNNNKHYFDKPYDITLCAQRMAQGHYSDIRFYWNRGLCLPLLKYNIDIRNWIPKVMCGGIEKYGSQSDDIDLWLISRLSCERAGTRFNVRGVNDDGAVANFVETEQIVLLPKKRSYSSFVIVRGSIPLFWQQPKFHVGTHRITLSRTEAFSFKAFFEHFKRLYRHYGRVLIINLIEQRDQEKHIGDEYRNFFNLLVKNFKQVQSNQLHEQNFIWFDYHEQARSIRNLAPEQFVQKLLIDNTQYPIAHELERQCVFTWIDGTKQDSQKGVFRINCIDCLDRTNNVQLTIGLHILIKQLTSLAKKCNLYYVRDHLREMWINNGDHISRIYTGTGALGQRSKAKDIQRSFGRAIQNNLRDDEKQQSIQTLIYSYSKDSYLHERSVAALFTPYVISDGLILSEILKNRENYVKREKIRISVGTWNINGDKNPALEHEYPAILDAWMLDGPENLASKPRKANAIPTLGYVTDDYEKSMPDILAIGFQEICDLTASNIVSKSSSNANRWVNNVQNHLKRNYRNHEYILLGMDQLVGVCLAIFIRRDLTSCVKHIGIDTVKTGMGGAIGNKGCVAIRLVLHSTSICFVCAHFTAGQNEYSERNKDYKTIMEKLTFQPPSRALWHDHIFFLGDFNYRLIIPRGEVERFVQDQSYIELLQYDQLKREHADKRVFHEFLEGPINFPPTYKYDVSSDVYDTSEKARTPSYTDRILWRSISHNIQVKQLYYGRAEVKTSDHRPVNSIFDVDIEICDEKKLYGEYVQLHKRLAPSNALIIYDMRADLNQRKLQVMDEFDAYVRRKYGTAVSIIDRFCTSNQRYLSLHMFFENGEHARRVMQPKEDQLPSGIYFSKRLIDLNEDIALTQKLNILFADDNQTMDPETTNYDLGAYQQPARESLSTLQDISVTTLVNQTFPRISSLQFKFDEQENEDIEKLYLVDEIQHNFERFRRRHGNIILTDFDENNHTTNDLLNKDNDRHSSYIPDDEHQLDWENSDSESLKTHLKERVRHWQNKHDHTHKENYMKQHGNQANDQHTHRKKVKIPGEESSSGGGNDTDENYQEDTVGELISFDSDHHALHDFSSNNNLQSQQMDALFSENLFDPYHFSSQPVSNNTKTNGDNLLLLDNHSQSAGSTFYIDSLKISSTPPLRQTDSPPLNMFSTSLVNPTHYENNNNRSTFYCQSPSQFVPTRPPPPVPIAATSAPAPIPNNDIQRPVTLKILNSNPFDNNNETISDLLGLGDPGSPPPSPKFDPFG